MASSNIKVASRHHKTRWICGPCVICGKDQPWYDHFCSLSHGKRAFFRRYASPNIAEDSHGHVLEAKRHKSDPKHTPTWKKENQSRHHCVYPQCSVPSQDTYCSSFSSMQFWNFPCNIFSTSLVSTGIIFTLSLIQIYRGSENVISVETREVEKYSMKYFRTGAELVVTCSGIFISPTVTYYGHFFNTFYSIF